MSTVIDLDDEGLRKYLQEIYKYPVLTLEDEQYLTRKYVETEDPKLASRLITSHLRLVSRIAMGYRTYGLPVQDLISEGVIGLMISVKKFNPYKGFRFSTYARWWVKAAIQEYVLRSWSLVKISASTTQKKLFFNLRRLKNKLGIFDENHLSQNSIIILSKELGVTEPELLSMNDRIGNGRDKSLNALIPSDDSVIEYQDLLVDESNPDETSLLHKFDIEHQSNMLQDALGTLSEREEHIVRCIMLQDDPLTLEQLSQELKVSRERIRQIKEAALKKLKVQLLEYA